MPIRECGEANAMRSLPLATRCPPVQLSPPPPRPLLPVPLLQATHTLDSPRLRLRLRLRLRTAPGRTEAVAAAADVVKEFYDGVNRRDLGAVEPLIADCCVYEDLVFARPFFGRKAILDFFNKFMGSISSDLQFVIDDISGDDTSAVGVTWHLEWKGRAFPFSKGCSFYRLEIMSDGARRIVYGRDCVEPAVKPGDLALILIRGVTWILERFPQLADYM